METLDNDILEPHVEYETASKGTRFANYIADTIITILLTVGIAYLISIALNTTISFSGLGGVFTLSRLTAFGYYLITEAIFHRSVGKMLTGTIVIEQGSGQVKFGTIILRTLSRYIPFNAFAYLFSDAIWHDSLTKTLVVHHKSDEA